ncbi:unnamed protein product [Periconia digitata]|uniref:Heterokaryon incompatibility domain-containing protein n=1 Tax=Periconia digitata TaxID=1303443 RepID=A0A9W4U613_9PLEO|nr:unnamed protein product [Periconia digitata]
MDDLSPDQLREYEEYAQKGPLWKKVQCAFRDELIDKDGLHHAASTLKLLLDKHIFAENVKGFYESLTRAQTTSWMILKHWYDGQYQHESLSRSAREFIDFLHITEAPTKWYTVDDFPYTSSSLYHTMMIRLFELEFYPRLINFSGEQDEVHMSWKELASMLRRVREEALLHATAQRFGFQHLPEQRRKGKPVLGLCSSTLEPCGWLPEFEDPTQMPYYVWDIAMRKTVVVSSLTHVPRYTCISHTWGRWRVPNTFHRVEGVPWPVPVNTRFDVHKLPDIFAANKWTTPYLWFDLYTIPQNGSKLADEEIARQHIIFRNSSAAVAWISGIQSWDKLSNGIEWLALSYLQHTSSPDLYDVKGALETVLDARNPPLETTGALNDVKEEEESATLQNQVLDKSSYTLYPGAWFTSLWTLQETFLCPHMVLVSQDWKPLQDKAGCIVTLDNLIALEQYALQYIRYSKFSDADFSDPSGYDANASWRSTQSSHTKPTGLPADVQEIQALITMTKASDWLRPSPISVLVLGNMRTCTESRAQAIMCILGTTAWYTKHVEKYGSRPPDKYLVLGMYPLPFLQEVIRKFGAAIYLTTKGIANCDEFFQGIDSDILSGSMLPFATGHSSRSVGSPINNFTRDDNEDHPDVSAWELQQDGTVRITRAGVLTASDYRYNDPQHTARVMDCRQERSSLEEVRLSEWLEQQPETHARFAVAVARDRLTLHGIILEGPRSTSAGTQRLLKTGIFTMPTLLFPRSSRVDWIVV